MPQEINYGLDPIEVIIRITPVDAIEFNKLNDFSIDQIKADVTGKELYCYFQKINEAEHKIFIPTLNGQLETIVKWYSVADTYQAVVDKKKKTIYRTAILTPQSDKSISETCIVKIIDINEGGKTNRASDEFEELYKKVCKQTIVSNINIQSQQEIWFKWIEAQKAIIQKLQEPIEIVGKPESKLTILPYKDVNGKPMTSYEISINIKETISSEYLPLETALKEYEITTPFNSDGTIMLTNEEIEKVLDPLIKSQFVETFERENEITAVVRIENRIDFSINRYFESIGWWNVKASLDKESNFLIFHSSSSKEIKLPRELREKYKLERKGIIATVRKRDSNGILETETVNSTLREGAFGKVVDAAKSKLESDLTHKCEAYLKIGFAKANFSIGELYSYQAENNFNENQFDDSFELSLKRDLIPYKDVIDFNPTRNSISFNFETREERESYTKFLKSLNKFHMVIAPSHPAFKFKVKTNFIAKKTQKQLFFDKLKKLRGAEFVADLNKKKEEPK